MVKKAALLAFVLAACAVVFAVTRGTASGGADSPIKVWRVDAPGYVHKVPCIVYTGAGGDVAMACDWTKL